MGKIILLILGIIVLITFVAIRQELKGHHPVILLLRWISGAHHKGHRYTNATWFRKGDKCFHPVGRCHPWHYLPRIYRAGIRAGSTIALISLGYGLLTARRVTIMSAELSAFAGIVGGAGYGIYRGRKYYNDRVTVNPLGEALAPILGIPASQAAKSLYLPPSHLTTREGEIGSLKLPDAFRADPGQQAAVQDLLQKRIRVDVDFTWHTADGRVAILASPKPPAMVRFADMIPYMESLGPQEIFLGLDRRHCEFNGSFDLDDPHWGFSVGSGRGKSTMLMATGAQVLHKDPANEFYGIDPKMNSLTPLVGIPGVYIACDASNIGEMWELLTMFHHDMMDEQAQVKEDPTLQFPFRLFAIDEVNTFAAMSKTYWRGIKSSGDPATPLIWSDVIAPILWMGRRVNRHMAFVGQRLDDKATGGIGLRDSLGFRGIAGFRGKNQYQMIIGGDGPVPKSQKPKGRWLYSDGQDETWVQNVYGSTIEIRDYAMAGRTAEDRRNAGLPPVAAPQAAPDGNRRDAV